MMLLRSSQYHYFQTNQGTSFRCLKFAFTVDVSAGKKTLGNLGKMLVLLQVLQGQPVPVFLHYVFNCLADFSCHSKILSSRGLSLSIEELNALTASLRIYQTTLHHLTPMLCRLILQKNERDPSN